MMYPRKERDFDVFKVKLLIDHHPEDFEDEWIDKGTEVYASWTPADKVYLSELGTVGKFPHGIQGSVFKTDAKVGVDYENV